LLFPHAISTLLAVNRGYSTGLEMVQKKGRKPPPQCKAILICERVIVEAVTGKCSVIGILTTFFVPNLTFGTPWFSVFLQLTNGAGQYEVTIEIHDNDDGSILAKAGPLPVQLSDRLEVKDVIIMCPPLIVQKAGPYELVVMADGQEIDRQRFYIHSENEHEGEEDDDNAEE
jgi:hypothetical protein